jgi:Uma2 family endonuclease
MEKTAERKMRIKSHFSKKEIPRSLVYEEYNGKPLYYRGYKDVLNGLKTFEEIMGQSDTQTIINGCLLNFLYKNLDDTKYFVASNEVGFHLKSRSNISSDIVIYDKSILQQHRLQDKYLAIAPIAVIEIDIQAETKDFGITELDYYSLKTRKLLDFGVQEAIWFFSKTKQVFYAEPGHDWLISSWNKEIVLLGQYRFSLEELLTKEGWVL